MRHTPVALPQGICYGWLEVPLSAEYPRYARQIIAELREVQLDKVYSSPSLRCVVLAEAIALTKGLTVCQDERLRELNFWGVGRAPLGESLRARGGTCVVCRLLAR